MIIRFQVSSFLLLSLSPSFPFLFCPSFSLLSPSLLPYNIIKSLLILLQSFPILSLSICSLSPYFSPPSFFISYFPTFFSPSPFSQFLDFSFFFGSTASCIFSLSLLISVLTSFSFHIFCFIFPLLSSLQSSFFFAFVSLLPLRLAYFFFFSLPLLSPLRTEKTTFFLWRLKM